MAVSYVDQMLQRWDTVRLPNEARFIAFTHLRLVPQLVPFLSV
jgi:hypothetical protein